MLDTALDARVSPETLRKIESGRVATPAFPTIAAIADVLGLSLDAVWAEINQPERPLNRPALVTTPVSGWPRKPRSPQLHRPPHAATGRRLARQHP